MRFFRGAALTRSDRLFLPLAAEPYSWFNDGQKTWELRTYNKRWNKKHVYEGRRVELRRGYRDKKTSIWGTIREVMAAPSISVFFDRVHFKEVIPRAISAIDAAHHAAAILGVDRTSTAVIGFRIELDSPADVQRIPLSEKYRSEILSGSKITTVRRGLRHTRAGPSILVFDKSDPVSIVVVRTEHKLVSQLDDSTARTDGFNDRQELLDALRSHYPGLGENDQTTVIHFRRS